MAGDGVDKNVQLAESYLMQAAENGLATAQYDYASRELEKGMDVAGIAPFMVAAAEQGHAPAFKQAALYLRADIMLPV